MEIRDTLTSLSLTSNAAKVGNFQLGQQMQAVVVDRLAQQSLLIQLTRPGESQQPALQVRAQDRPPWRD